MLSSSNKFELIYPTPLLQREFENTALLNESLKEYLLQLEKEQPERNTGNSLKSNVAGWRSKDNLLNSNHPSIKQLMEMMFDTLKLMLSEAPKSVPNDSTIEMVAWANINREGAFNTPHIHPGFHFAGIYYVSIGNPDNNFPRNGQLEILEPRGSALAMPVPGFKFGATTHIKAVPGLLVMFPAWLMHTVTPYKGDGERISIPFNIRIK